MDLQKRSKKILSFIPRISSPMIPCKTRDREIKERWREVKEQRPFIVLYISDIFFRDL